MAARAFLELNDDHPAFHFAPQINETPVFENRISLQAAAIRNSMGKHYSQQSYAAPKPITHDRLQPPQETSRPDKQQNNPQPQRKKDTPTAPTFENCDLPPAMRAKALEWHRRQQSLVTTTNWRLSSGNMVLAWNILPLQLFEGELGRFLILACDFHAYGPGNTMLLPSMPAGAQQLNLPRHPLVVSKQHLQNALQHITLLRDRVAAEHRRACLALQKGDLSQIYARADSKRLYCQELSKIVKDIATAELGVEAVNAHQVLFEPYIAML